MKTLVMLCFVLVCAACSKDPDPSNNGENNGTDDASTAEDAGGDDAATQPDTAADEGASDDGAGSFCTRADCDPDTICSDALERCVGCLADNDCPTGNLRACDDAAGPAGEEPSYECVECVDDAVCAGGTCDLTTHTCGL